MSWKRKEAEPIHIASMDGFRVVGVLTGLLPCVEERARIRFLEKRPWNIIEEFVARSIGEVGGFQSAEEIAGFLGLKHGKFLEPVLSQLRDADLISLNDAGELVGQERLSFALREKCFPVQREVRISSLTEPVSGERKELSAVAPEQLEEKLEASNLAAEDQEGFRSWLTGRGGPLQGVDLVDLSFENRVVRSGVRCDVVLFLDESDCSWGWTAFDPVQHKLAPHWNNACARLAVQREAEAWLREREAEEPSDYNEKPGETYAEIRLLELERALNETHQRAEKDANTRIGSIERLTTTAAADQMRRSVASANNEILLRFPWIKKGALSDVLLKALKSAVHRGTNIIVFWGIAGAEGDENSDLSAINTLRGIADSKTGNAIAVVWTGMNHSKELLVDREHYFGGSFNFLSFRGDPDRRSGMIRREIMIHCTNRELIDSVVEDLVPLARQKLIEETKRSEESHSFWSWARQWRNLLALGADSSTVSEALSKLPSPGRNLGHAAIAVIDGAERNLDREEASNSLETLFQWLALTGADARLDRPQRKMLGKCRARIEALAQELGVDDGCFLRLAKG